MCVCIYIYIYIYIVVQSPNHIQLFAILWTVAHQDPLPMGFSRPGYWSVLPCPPPGDLPDPEIELMSLKSPSLAVRFFTIRASWEALIICMVV